MKKLSKKEREEKIREENKKISNFINQKFTEIKNETIIKSTSTNDYKNK